MLAEDDDRIRERAYRIWEREGRPDGRAAAHWEMARDEIAIERNQALAMRPNPAREKGGFRRVDEAEPLTAAEEAFADMPGPAGQERGETVPYPFTPDAIPESADSATPAARLVGRLKKQRVRREPPAPLSERAQAATNPPRKPSEGC